MLCFTLLYFKITITCSSVYDYFAWFGLVWFGLVWFDITLLKITKQELRDIFLTIYLFSSDFDFKESFDLIFEMMKSKC